MERPSRIEYSSREILLEDSPLKQNELEAMESFVPDFLVTEKINYLDNSLSHKFGCNEANEAYSCSRSGSAFGSEEEMISSPRVLISDEGLTFKTSRKRKLEESEESSNIENNLGYLLDQAETDGLTPFQETNYPYFGARTPVNDFEIGKGFHLDNINSPNCFPETLSFHSLIEKDIKYSGSVNELECHGEYISKSSEIWIKEEPTFDPEISRSLQNPVPNTRASSLEVQLDVRTSPSECTKDDASAKDISNTSSYRQEKSLTSDNNGSYVNQSPTSSSLFNQECQSVGTTSLLNNSVPENNEHSSIIESLECTIISESPGKSKSISSFEISSTTPVSLAGKPVKELQQPESHKPLQLPINSPINTSTCNVPTPKKLNSNEFVANAEGPEIRNSSPKNSNAEKNKPVSKNMLPPSTLSKKDQNIAPSQGADQTLSNSSAKRPSKSSKSKLSPVTQLNKSCNPSAPRKVKSSNVCGKTLVTSNVLPQTSCNTVLPQHSKRQEFIPNIPRFQVCTTLQNPSQNIRSKIAGSFNCTTSSCTLGNCFPGHVNSPYPNHTPLYGQRPNFQSSNVKPSSCNVNPPSYSNNFAPSSSNSPISNSSPSFNKAKHYNSTGGNVLTNNQPNQPPPYYSNGSRFHYSSQSNNLGSHNLMVRNNPSYNALSPNSINFSSSLPNATIRPQIPDQTKTKPPTVSSDLPHQGNFDPFQSNIDKVRYFSRYPWVVSDESCLRCNVCENTIISALQHHVNEITSAVEKHRNLRSHVLFIIVKNKEKFAVLCKILKYQVFSMENKNDLLQSLGHLYGYEQMSEHALTWLIEALHGVINDFHHELHTNYKFTLCIDICRGFAYFRTSYGGAFQEHFLPYDINNGKLMQAIGKVKANLISRYEYLSCGKCAVCSEIKCKVPCVPLRRPLVGDLLNTLKMTKFLNTYVNVIDTLSLLYQSYSYFFHSLPNAENFLTGLCWYKIETFRFIQIHKEVIRKICRNIFDKFGDILALGISSDYPEFTWPHEQLIYFLDFFVKSIEELTESLPATKLFSEGLKRSFHSLKHTFSAAQFTDKEAILTLLNSFIDEIGKDLYYSDKLNKFSINFLFDCSKLSHIMNDESSQYTLLLLYNQVKTTLNVSFQVLLQSLIALSENMLKKNIRITNFLAISQCLHNQETSLKYPGVKDFYAAIGCLPFSKGQRAVSFSLMANFKHLLSLKYGEVLAKDLVCLVIEIPHTYVGVEESRNKMLKRLLGSVNQTQKQTP